MSHVYDGPEFERATSRNSLLTRLEINKAYGSSDFDRWLLEHLAVEPGEDILDVGCGTGAQTLPLAERIGPNGSVSAIDVSADSVVALRAAIAPSYRIQAEVGDMAELQYFIDSVFAVKRYDLAHSTYALYYAKEWADVLTVMMSALKPEGRLAVFTPNAPHGLVDFAAQFSNIPQPVFDSLKFGPGVLDPWFQRNFAEVEVHHFHNEVSIPGVDDVITFYRATTYYDAASEHRIRDAVEQEIARTGQFVYEKNGFLIIGRQSAHRG